MTNYTIYAYIFTYIWIYICISILIYFNLYLCVYIWFIFIRMLCTTSTNSVAIDYSYAASTVKPPNSPATPQGGTHIYTHIYIYIYLYTLAYWIYYTTDTPLPTHTAGGSGGAGGSWMYSPNFWGSCGLLCGEPAERFVAIGRRTGARKWTGQEVSRNLS